MSRSASSVLAVLLFALAVARTQGGVRAQPLSFARGEASGPPPKPTPPPKPLDAPIDVLVPIAPTPFVGGDGRTHLVYEAHVTNFAPRDIQLRRFEVLAPDGKLLSR